jgi:pimeloyl-ACP methyl ester carboxylesterase
MVNEHSITANGVALCTEAFGDPGNPPVLLIMGACVSMLGWDDRLCQGLAAGGRYVIRYDHRDTGRSVTYEPGKPQYTLQDMAADAVGVLDAYRLGRAHLVGMSLGGIIAQLLTPSLIRAAQAWLPASAGRPGVKRGGLQLQPAPAPIGET